jgi:flagellar biosynthesis/type III secretory pathway protein FliH
MPKIFTTKTKGSFRNALSKMRTGILPDKIQGNSLAMWVMNFDELSQEKEERSYKSDYPEKEIIARWSLGTALGIALQRQLPFYFSSLFYIGRQWYVSERTIASIQLASSPENITASVELTKQNISARKTEEALAIRKAPNESLTEVFRSILDGGLEYHQAQLRQAHIWWDEWQDEVRVLKKVVDSYRESSLERIRDYVWSVSSQVIIGSYQVSSLRSSMTSAGITFKGDAAAQGSPAGYSSELDPMLPMLIAALTAGIDRERSYYEFERFFHYWLDIRRYAPEVQIALENLNKKYGSKNPFDPYQPSLKAASQELRALIQEHRLPNHNPSPWLHAWFNSLEEDPWWTPLQYHSLENPEVIQSFLRSADSAIKRQLGHTIRPGETWQTFIQRLFEYGWVSRIAHAIADANKKPQSKTTSWNFQSFVELIMKVIEGLQGIGYELTFIKEERCLVVWNKVHEQGSISDEDW